MPAGSAAARNLTVHRRRGPVPAEARGEDIGEGRITRRRSIA